MPINWSSSNLPTTDGEAFLFTNGQFITSVDQTIAADFLMEASYEILKKPATSQITLDIELTLEELSTNTITCRRYDGLGTQSHYEVLYNGSSQGTLNVSGNADCLSFSRAGNVLIIASDEYGEVGVVTGVSTENLKTIEIEVAADAQLLTSVDYVRVYDTVVQTWDIATDSYGGVDIFPFRHNWIEDFGVQTNRFGTRLEFGRGRVVSIDSTKPQQSFAQKSLFNRAEAFEFLRWFDQCRGRLVRFWLPHPLNLFEVVSSTTTDITVKGQGLDPADITDFYKYLRGVGDTTIMEITGVTTSGDNLVISSDQIPAGFSSEYLQTVHLVRFAKDSIREVWTNRNVCEIAYDIVELLEPLEEIVDSQWGGLPSDNSDPLEFGGLPDSVISDVYSGGLPDGTLDP